MGFIVTFEEIFESIWPPNASPYKSNLRVLVSPFGQGLWRIYDVRCGSVHNDPDTINKPQGILQEHSRGLW